MKDLDNSVKIIWTTAILWIFIPFGICHSQQVGNSSSFDLWSVSVIFLSEGIFDSPQRDQEFQPTTPDGSLEAKITCSVAYYICYSHEHTLCLSTHSFQVLPWWWFFFRTFFQGELPNHRKGKHYNLLLTVNGTISLGERIRETQRGKKENGRVRIWQRHVSDFYTIQTLDIKYRRTTWE